MNQYKSGRYTGEKAKPVPSVRRKYGKNVFGAGLMSATGVLLAVAALAVPQKTHNTLALPVSASGYDESYVPPIIEETEPEAVAITYPKIKTLYADILPEKNQEDEFNADDYTTSWTSEEITTHLDEVAAESKAVYDSVYRPYNYGATVSSANRDLYLSNYKYGSTQYITAGGYVGLNSLGVPMSEYAVPADLTLDENGVPEHYSYCINGTATAYYSGTTTATGTSVCQGVVAVDPRQIPYGTEMWITSADGRYVYGYCRAEDTGGFIYFENGATVDLYMRSYNDCVSWGFRNVRIYILSR